MPRRKTLISKRRVVFMEHSRSGKTRRTYFRGGKVGKGRRR